VKVCSLYCSLIPRFVSFVACLIVLRVLAKLVVKVYSILKRRGNGECSTRRQTPWYGNTIRRIPTLCAEVDNVIDIHSHSKIPFAPCCGLLIYVAYRLKSMFYFRVSCIFYFQVTSLPRLRQLYVLFSGIICILSLFAILCFIPKYRLYFILSYHLCFIIRYPLLFIFRYCLRCLFYPRVSFFVLSLTKYIVFILASLLHSATVYVYYSGNVATVMEIDHDSRRVISENIRVVPNDVSSSRPSEDAVAARLTSPIVTTYVDTEKIAFERSVVFNTKDSIE